MKAKSLYYLLFSLLFLSRPGILLSQANSIFHVLCYERMVPWIEKIMVGCEAWDCCTGCPKSPIELRFRLAAEPGVALVLKLENADKNLKQQLKLEGNIRWLNDNELELKAGVARIMGFPPDNNVLISPRYSITEKQLYTKEKAVKLKSNLPKSLLVDTASLSVKKYLSGYLLDERQYISRFYWCKWPIPPPKPKSYEDRIQQINNTGDNSVIVADGKKWLIGCEEDEIYFPVTGTVSVGNFMNSGECNAETFVFSKDNAMAAVVPSTEWDFRSGNLQTVQLSPMIEVPVLIWLAPSILRDRVVTEVNRANFLLNYNRAGIILIPEYRDIPAGSAELSFIEPMRCENAAQIAGSIFYAPGKINIYYTQVVLDFGGSTTGRCCFNDNHREIIGISLIGNTETLVHEIGHSFSLDHTNDIPEIGQLNIMHGGGIFRNIFTEGQDFRINVNSNSTVNTLGFRVGQPTRLCNDNVTNNICVPLSLDRPN